MWRRGVVVSFETARAARSAESVSMVGRVLHHESVQVALTEDDDSVEDLASTGANPPFGDSDLPGTPVGRPDGVDAHPLERAVDIGAELGVAVEDEMAGNPWRPRTTLPRHRRRDEAGATTGEDSAGRRVIRVW